MGIYLNGGQNPVRVFCDGEVDRVWATGGIWHPFPVWEKAGAFPSEIELATVSMSDGCKAYFRDMAPDSVRNVSSGAIIARYRGDVTIETAFQKGKQIGPNPLNVYLDYEWTSGAEIASVAGIPGGYAFVSGQSEDSPGNTVAYDVYKWTVEGQLRESEREAMSLQTTVTLESGRHVEFVTKSHRHNWYVLTGSSGWVYQGAGFLEIKRQ